MHFGILPFNNLFFIMFGRVLPELSEIIIQIGESFLKNQFAANGINMHNRGEVYLYIHPNAKIQKKIGICF